MKFKFLSLPLVVFLTQPAFAASALSPPAACPSIAAIKAVGVNRAEDNALLGWTAISSKNHYGTPQEWSFVIFVGESNDEKEAIERGNAAIGLLSQVEGPLPNEGEKDWGCLYTDTTQSILAFAGTPPEDMPEMIVRFRR